MSEQPTDIVAALTIIVQRNGQVAIVGPPSLPPTVPTWHRIDIRPGFASFYGPPGVGVTVAGLSVDVECREVVVV